MQDHEEFGRLWDAGFVTTAEDGTPILLDQRVPGVELARPGSRKAVEVLAIRIDNLIGAA